MSYTPLGEDIREPTRKLVDNIGPVREAMMARIRDSAGYKDGHIAGLRLMVVRLTQLELDLLELLG